MIDQQEIDSLIGVAYQDLLQNRISSSVKGLRKVLELDPDNLEVHYLLGIALVKAGLYEDAVDHLKTVIDSEYNYLHTEHAYMLLGYVYSRLELFDDGIRMFEHAQQIDFNNDRACAALGHLYYKTGRINEAKQILQYALKINPDNHNARNSLAYVMSESENDLNQALDTALLAVQADPGNYVYQDTLGWIYHKKGKESLAKATLQRALELAPENEEIKEHLRCVLDME